MNEQNDFWGDTPDWTESVDRPGRGRRADETIPQDRPARSVGFGSKMKNLWGSAMSTGADATREHNVIDASKISAETTGMFDDLDVDEYDAVPPRSARTARTTPPRNASERESFDVGPIGWSGDDWFDDDAELPAVELDVDEFAPLHATENRSERRGGGIDPLLTRIGAAIVVTTLMVPLAVGLSSNDGPSELIASADTEVPSDAPVISLTPVATQPAAPAVDPADEVYLDPSQLPPAIPVNTELVAAPAESTETASEPSTEPVTDAQDEGTSVASGEMTAPAAESRAEQDAGTIDQPVAADDPADRVLANCAVDYTVVQGDFWIRLADAAGVELAELLEANGATVDTPLYPGSDICLPAGSTTPPPPTTTAPDTTSTTTSTTSTSSTTSTTTSTSTTSTTSTTTTTVPTSPPGPEEIKQIIRDVWPDELEERALEIAYRESRYVPTAKNFCCYGLFQMYWTVHQSWLADIGITDDQQLYDPETNARAAYALYQRAGGWGPWAL